MQDLNVSIEKHLNGLEEKKLISDQMFNIYDSTPIRFRPSLIELSKLSGSYGLVNYMIVDPASSDDEPEDADLEPSARQVCETLFDINTLIQLEREKDEFPEGVRHGVIIKNIDDDITANEMKSFLEDIPIFKNDKITIDELRIFPLDFIRYASVIFSEKDECDKVMNFFNDPEKLKNTPTLNSQGEIISFSLCYDLTDLKDSKWFAVVLRNLDSVCETDKIEDYCSSFNEGVLYALDPITIYDSTCSVVVMDNLDNAEKLCVKINQSKIKGIFTGKRLKANVHSKSSKRRENAEESHFAAFFTDKKISDSNKMEINHKPAEKIKKGISVKEKTKKIKTSKLSSLILQKSTKASINIQAETNSTSNKNRNNNSFNEICQKENSLEEKQIPDISHRIKIESMMSKLNPNVNKDTLNDSIHSTNSKDSKKNNSHSEEKKDLDGVEAKVKMLRELISIKNSSVNIGKQFISNKREREREILPDIQTPIIHNTILSSNKKMKLNSFNPFADTIPLGSNKTVKSNNENKSQYYSSLHKLTSNNLSMRSNRSKPK